MKASEIVRVGLVAILAVLAFKLVAYKLNIPGLRNAAAML